MAVPQTSGDPVTASVARVRQRIQAAAHRVGRDPREIRLLPVTKTVPAQRLRVLPELGLRHFGENRVQEIREKSAELANLGVEWTVIGHLQTNKAKLAARLATEVQSVDSLKVALALDAATHRLLSEGERDRPLSVLLQVNVSGEESKHGFRPEETADALARIQELSGVKVRGLMTMAPFTEDQEMVRRTFAGLRELRDELTGGNPEAELRELSMGMSHDYQIAIEEGATIVRVGSAIFGPRTAL